MIEIDGSRGEGGGQILRSALSVAVCTGQAFRMIHIRAGRERPGLLRQHLTAVPWCCESSALVFIRAVADGNVYLVSRPA